MKRSSFQDQAAATTFPRMPPPMDTTVRRERNIKTASDDFKERHLLPQSRVCSAVGDAVLPIPQTPIAKPKPPVQRHGT